MHELAITKAIIEAIKAKDSPRHAIVDLGTLTTYKKDPIMYYFDMLKEESGLKDTELKINVIPGKVICNECKEESIVKPYMIICKHCNSLDVEIIQGKEIDLR
jgi:hydrogenase nickel incorporation protein HypA/HybF